MDFYKIVSDICDKRNITLCSLLSQLEMSKANIRNWRNGVIPKISVRQKIAEITDTPVENLLTNESQLSTKFLKRTVGNISPTQSIIPQPQSH